MLITTRSQLPDTMDLGLISDLIAQVSSGDGNAVVNNTKPKSNPKPTVPGSKKPH